MKKFKTLILIWIGIALSQVLLAQNNCNYQVSLSANVYRHSNYNSNGEFYHNNGGGNLYVQNLWIRPLLSDSLLEHSIGIVNTNYLTISHEYLGQVTRSYCGISNSLGLSYIRKSKRDRFTNQMAISSQVNLSHLFNNFNDRKYFTSYGYLGLEYKQSLFFKLNEKLNLGPFAGVNLDFKNKGYQDYAFPGWNKTTHNRFSLGWRIGLALDL